MNRFIVSLHRTVAEDPVMPVNISHSVALAMDSGLTLFRLEDIVGKYLNHVRFSEHDNDVTIDARVSGIDWTSITDMYPGCKVIVAVGSTTDQKHPFILIIEEI